MNVAVLSGSLSSDVVVTLVTQDAEAAGKLHSKYSIWCVCMHVSVCPTYLLAACIKHETPLIECN